MSEQITPHPVGKAPWSTDGIERDADGIAHYTELPASLIALFQEQVEQRPDAECIIEVGGGRMTYREVWDAAARVAGGLRAAGVQDGDRVAILTPAGNDWVLAFWGALLAGAVAVPVNTRFAQPEIDYVLEDCGASFVFGAGEPLPNGDPYVAEGKDLQDLAGIFYTSGTTGRPKGAQTTHEAFLTNTENMCRGMGFDRTIGADYRTLISVPLFHVTGCNSQLLVAMYVGGASVILPELNVITLMQTIVDERISAVTTVPAVYKLMMLNPEFSSYDMSGVRWVGYGGAPIAPALVHQLREAFPQAGLKNGFGMTESASLMTVLPDQFAADHADTVGFAMPVVDLAIDLPDESGVGELLARGPNITTGYWNKPDATLDAFDGDWLHTGDLARIDDDGFVRIVDRAKDMINRGGENVYCVEVENALAAIPGVAESAVIAVPDEVMGEKVGAVVVPAPGAELDPKDIVRQLEGALADFKIPQFIHIAGEPLPRNPGGKVLKPGLRKQTQWGAPLR
ncbi:class I adenylate-forming enzyme family protein [Blastococcus sp. Marseille-P5729]|uniref:class I adenylate-forming enzyme family protein n=1 Tax=Blastococcus sp. Marseille-P5729 TaxID=2086582 RepID=UPI000D0FA721|nr:AMP-binding protein [Blastococcus sp. Marseille-P5729]